MNDPILALCVSFQGLMQQAVETESLNEMLLLNLQLILCINNLEMRYLQNN